MRAPLLIAGLVLLAHAATATSLASQDITADPAYGDVRLKGGFIPDPHEVKLTAGGSIEVDKEGCSYGFVANAPDVDFYYEGDGSRTLYISVESDDDTMLLVNDPDADWSCDDDSKGELNPLLVIPAAESGLYNIWVGTYEDDTAAATLRISEIDPR